MLNHMTLTLHVLLTSLQNVMSNACMYQAFLAPRQAMGSDHATPLPVVLQTKGQLAVPAQHGQDG